jgi:hypothetical protein
MLIINISKNNWKILNNFNENLSTNKQGIQNYLFSNISKSHFLFCSISCEDFDNLWGYR